MRAAAAELNLTQPAVTKILKDIEEILQVTLFERRSTGITPTPIGMAVVDFARKTVSDVERFAGLVTNLKLGGYGSLKIGAILATIPGFLPLALTRLKAERPLMTIHFLAATSNQLLEELNNRTIDLAVARFTGPEQSVLFDFEPLLDEEIWVFTHADHPLGKRDLVELREVYDYPWVLQPPMSPLRNLLTASFADAGIGALPNWIETTSIYATLKIVHQGRMLAALPRAIVEEGVKSGTFVRLNVPLSGQLSKYGLVTRADEELSDNMKLFVRILRESAGDFV